jgi:hypothetical protein
MGGSSASSRLSQSATPVLATRGNAPPDRHTSDFVEAAWHLGTKIEPDQEFSQPQFRPQRLASSFIALIPNLFTTGWTEQLIPDQLVLEFMKD